MWKSPKFIAMKQSLRKCSTILLVLFLGLGFIRAQDFSSNISLQTKHWLRKHQTSNSTAHLLVQGEDSEVKQACKLVEGNFKYCRGNVCAVSIPAAAVMEFARQSGVGRIEGPGTNGLPLMDTAILVNRIADVHAGIGLSQSYEGEGVIIGFIDDGIYFNHGDFLREDSTTRIRYIWDQNAASGVNSPAPYNYGREWSWLDIDAGNCAHVEQGNGHGTNVAGIAAGDGSTDSLFKGVAPKAEIIAVSINYNAQFLSNVADAADYIFKKADALGKPCVINTSLGTYVGGRDGKDLTSQLINNLLEERPGRALVAAGGNAREFDYHLGYSAGADTNFTWFNYNAANNWVAYEFWIDSVDLQGFHYSFGVNSDTNFAQLGKSGWLDFQTTDLLAQNMTTRTELIRQGSIVYGSAEVAAEKYQGTYHIVVIIRLTPGIPSYRDLLYSLKITGSGRFDLWSDPTLTNGSSMVNSNLPPVSLFPEIQFYKLPDNLSSIVSSWQCSDHVLTVGNFSNRARYLDADSNIFQTGEVPGALYRTSSLGPARGGMVKPDLAATGSTTLSTGNLDHIFQLINVGPNESFKVAYGGLHNRNGGTSMASPIVAGLVALYLEKEPNADWSEIKQVILQNTYQDNFTGAALPDERWGYGKVDGISTMQFNVIRGCMDSTAFNYDPTANVDDGSCIPIIFGCLDSSASNYNPMANTADSCLYDTIPSGINLANKPFFKVFPNPASELLIVEISNLSGQDISFSMYSNLGTRLFQKNLTLGKNTIRLEDYPSGLYLYRIGDETGKILIE